MRTIVRNPLLFAAMGVLLVLHTSAAGQQSSLAKIQLETTYDSAAGKTTVRLRPVKISGDMAQYHSLHMSPSFSFPGRQPVRPRIIDFELQTVVKGRLNSDLYVVFIIDGQSLFLSSNRWAIRQPVPGRVWMGERMVFRMPYETLLKLAAATDIQIKMDNVRFQLGEAEIKIIQEFAAEVAKLSE